MSAYESSTAIRAIQEHLKLLKRSLAPLSNPFNGVSSPSGANLRGAN